MMDPDLLTDGWIINASRGTGTVQIGEWRCTRKEGERMEFLERARGEYRAWYDEQKAQEARKARASQASSGEGNRGTGVANVAPTPPVQTNEAGLGAVLRSQISSLDARIAVTKRNVEDLGNRLVAEQRLLQGLTYELSLARKFLKEIGEDDDRAGDQQEVPQAMGGDLSRQVGQRKPRGGKRVGKAGHPQVGGAPSTGPSETPPPGSV